MQAACDLAFEYVHVREQFGKQIGTFQLMQVCNVETNTITTTNIAMWILMKEIWYYEKRMHIYF